MSSLIAKIFSAVTHPRAAFGRLTQRLDFSELVILQDLEASGLLAGITGVIDAGAHHGNYARVFAHVLPQAKILCFEPLPETYRILVERTAANPRISPHRVALGSKVQRSVMNVSGVDQASSLLQMNDTHTELWPESANVSTADVVVTTLDHFLESHPLSGDLFLKMDVQGFELELLKGATRSLGQVRVIRFEASFVPLYLNAPKFSEICAFLETRGFRFFRIMGEIRAKAADFPVQADVLFVRA
jgi:FkbM family methyltransferase